MSITIEHRPEGYACNMGYVLVVDGVDVHRGPKWSCDVRKLALGRGQSLYADKMLTPYGIGA